MTAPRGFDQLPVSDMDANAYDADAARSAVAKAWERTHQAEDRKDETEGLIA